MHILILDDKLNEARKMAEDIAYHSEGQIQADAVSNVDEAAQCIVQRRNNKLLAYGALLIDVRLGGGEEGIEAMKRLLSESPESEALLFTARDDAQVGLRAIRAGALHYFDRTQYTTDELLLRLNEIRALHEFDEAVILANTAKTLDDTAKMIVKSGRRLGFERARLWRCAFDKIGEVRTFEGWTQDGNDGLASFDTVKMPVEKSSFAPILLEHPHDVCIFAGRSSNDLKESYLASHFGQQGYLAPAGEWSSLRLRWDGATRAVLMLDDATHADHVIEIAQQKLLLRFARSAASALARAAAMDEQMRSQAIAKRVVELIADKDIDVALEEIATQLCKDDPAIANTKLKIVLRNEQALTADYRCVSGACKFERPYRHSLDRGYLVPCLLNEQECEPLLLSDTESLQEYRATHEILYVDKLSHSFVYVPLCVGGKVTGALVLDNDVDETIHYSEEQVTRLKRVAIEIAAGVEAGRLREAAEKSSVRRETLIEVRKAIDDSTKSDSDRQETWHLILTALTAGYGIGFNRACLFLVDKSSDLVTETGIGYQTIKETHEVWEKLGHSDADSHPTSFNLVTYRSTREKSEGVTPLEIFAKRREKFPGGAALSDGTQDYTKLTADDTKSRLPKTFVEFIGATPCALIPVRAGEHVLGVVYVDNHAEENYITWESLEEARALLSYAAQAFQSQREREQRMELIELSNQNFDEGALKENLQRICDEALSLTDADLVVIYPMQPGKMPEKMLNIDDDSCAVAAGSSNPEITKHTPRLLHDGLTFHVLSDKRFVVRDVTQFNEREFSGYRLSEHPLIRDQNLKGLISTSLFDDIQKDSFGVLHLGYRHLSEDVVHEEKQANFIARIARRAIRSEWWRTNEKLLRGAEAQAHREIMELSLSTDATEDGIAELAANKMRELLGKERVNQESTVALLKWQSATQIERAQRFRVDYQIRTPDFQSIKRERLNDSNLKSDKVYFGVTGKALQQSDYVYVRDVKDKKYRSVYYQVNSDTQCELALRLTTKEGEPIGVLNVESDTVDAFETDLKEAVNILGRLAGTLVNALENVRRQARSTRVMKAFQEIVAPFGLTDTLQNIIEAARDIAEGVTTITIWYVDSDNPDRLFNRNWGCFSELEYKAEPDGSIRRENAPYISQTLEQIEPHFWHDAQGQDTPSDYVSKYGIASTAHLPLTVHEKGKNPETVGVMFLNFVDRHVFTNEDKTLFQALANIASASIRDANMAQKMRRDASIASYIASYTSQVQEMAHDLKSQIGLMGSNLQRLKKSSLSEEQNRWLKVIDQQLDEMIDGLPALHTKLDDRVYPVKLDEVRQIVDDMIKSQPKSRGLAAKFDLPEGILLKANHTLLKRALNHLLRNSLNPKHETHNIFVHLDNREIESHRVSIVLADDGNGLTPEIAARILREPISSTSEDGRSRLSMGLLFARNQVEQMGGTLTYLGNYQNRGAAFELVLNIAQTKEGDQNDRTES